MTLTVVSFGGTGARCAESIAHLAAMGAFRDRVRFLLIDMDQQNGNLDRTREIINRYRRLQSHKFSDQVLSDPMDLEIWRAPQEEIAADQDLAFSEAIGIQNLTEPVRQFIRLFFRDDYDSHDLKKGCFQSPEIGALILRRLLRGSLTEADNGLKRTLEDLNSDLQNGEAVRIFVVGSTFGGTGASGLPFLPTFLTGDDVPRLWPDFKTRGSQLRLGGAFLTPYFQWQGKSESKEGHGPEVGRLAPHARSILLHYSRHFPGYDRVYVLGSPVLTVTCDENQEGGNKQLHRSHYIEWVTALAALDFYRTATDDLRPCAFVESTTQAGQGKRQRGINWETMPLEGDDRQKRAVRRGFLASSLFFGFLRSHILPGLDNGEFHGYPWFEEAMEEALPSDQRKLIEQACDAYLLWLSQVLDSISSVGNGTDHPSLLALKDDQLSSVGQGSKIEDLAEDLPSLLLTGESNRAVFHRLCNAMDRVSPSAVRSSDANETPLGRLLLLVSQSVDSALNDGLVSAQRVQSGVARDEEDPVQSRYLPRVDWESTALAQIGEFSRSGKELLADLGKGLKIGEKDDARSNPISSPWAQQYLFETNLFGNGPGRSRAVEEWRGLLGILAFRELLGNGIAVEEIDLDLTQALAQARNRSAVEEFVLEARAYGKEHWLRFRILTVANRPVAGSSPLTLVCPSPTLGRDLEGTSAIPWFDSKTGRLRDPADYFAGHDHVDAGKHLGLLRSWIDHLLERHEIFEKTENLDRLRNALEDWRRSPRFRAAEALEPGVAWIDNGFFGPYSLPAIPTDWRMNR